MYSNRRFSVLNLVTLMAAIVLGVLGCGSPIHDPAKLDSTTPETHPANDARANKNVIRVSPGGDPVGFSGGRIETLTVEDAEAIATRCPSVMAAAPVVRARRKATFGKQTWAPLWIYGTTPAFLKAHNWENLTAGESFSQDQVRNSEPVCLVGQTIAHALFADASPLGQQLQIDSHSFRVIGVLRSKGANSFGMDQDDIILLPLTTIEKLISNHPAESADGVFARAISSEKLPAAMREIEQVLRERHHLTPSDSNDFRIMDVGEWDEEAVRRGATEK